MLPKRHVGNSPTDTACPMRAFGPANLEDSRGLSAAVRVLRKIVGSRRLMFPPLHEIGRTISVCLPRYAVPKRERRTRHVSEFDFELALGSTTPWLATSTRPTC